MRIFFLLAVLSYLLPSVAQASEAPCGPEAACEIEGGSYHLLTPPEWDGEKALPAIFFYHGHRSSGTSVFRGGALKSVFAEAGYLVIAPNGATAPGSDVRRWPARPGAGRDDVAFSLAVLEDAAGRVPINRERVYASGFSAGGSMAWMMACYAGEHFAGFVSISGALRRPVPKETCPAGPVRLLQIHGFADRTVPLEGRGIGDWHQGDVFESFGLARRTANCRSQPDEITLDADFRCREWTSCDSGALKLCLHDGGHGLPKGWADLGRDWLEAPLR
ncbi:alpha/beta hydrolase family esterase [Algicella marina]|uniref:Polyhydroxybutyrate depolymerase n=1 Tax=Algicella marina TaxID=2683284 RepID=A0A6P1SWY2_9RHOB|nr:PHB depolymerase family esterase [Algicella marina]QHQ34170.1 polyhydroxybutyrate depolymerase [Algicella marina]